MEVYKFVMICGDGETKSCYQVHEKTTTKHVE
jgi:hypothetical protein